MATEPNDMQFLRVRAAHIAPWKDLYTKRKKSRDYGDWLALIYSDITLTSKGNLLRMSLGYTSATKAKTYAYIDMQKYYLCRNNYLNILSCYCKA